MRKTHYDILGVARDATQDQIRSAYRNLAMKWHPDRWVNCSHDERMEAERRMKQINDAYEVLSDPERRSRYDIDLLAEEERIRDEKSRQHSRQRQASSRSSQSGSGDKAGSRRSPGSHHNQRCYQEPGYSSFNALGLVNAILKSKTLRWILVALVLKLLGLLWLVPAVLALGFVVILALIFI